MANEFFLDTSGIFALFVDRDDQHGRALQVMKSAQARKRRVVTTDYVLSETATLLRARGEQRVVGPFFDYVFESVACRICWTDEARFTALRTFFLRHSDQTWSFTDCLSFMLMKELRIREALTKDAHFEQAGFVALLS